MRKIIALGIMLLFLGMTISSSTGIIVFNDDTTPPVTTCTLDPPEPDGDNGWYVSNVTVTLNATDDMSGVNATYYRIDGGSWQTYSEPFIVEEDGVHVIYYYSVDNDGNSEDVKSADFKMDQTPPHIELDWEVFKDDGIWFVRFIVTCIEHTSGKNRVEFYLNDELQGTITGHGPTYEFTLIWEEDHKYFAIAFDMAGNERIGFPPGSSPPPLPFIGFAPKVTLRSDFKVKKMTLGSSIKVLSFDNFVQKAALP